MSDNTQQLEPSEEADERHLELARRTGQAYQQAVEHMIDDVAEAGGTTEVEDYILGFAQEEAEGLYRMQNGELQWSEPVEGDNCHLEVVVADAADGRFVPGATVRATLRTEDGDELGPTELPLVWHPGLYHYGTNLALPGDGTYEIEIEVDAPTFPRHDEQNGQRFEEPVEVTFPDVEVETGRS